MKWRHLEDTSNTKKALDHTTVNIKTETADVDDEKKNEEDDDGEDDDEEQEAEDDRNDNFSSYSSNGHE